MAKIQLSPQQQAFIDWCRDGRGSAVLEAVAGAGKTTTILEAVDVIHGGCAILAYNKEIANEIKAKLTKRGVDWKKAQAGTVHSFGFNAYRKAFPQVKVNEHKVADMLEAAVGRGELQHLRAYLGVIAKLVGLAKQRAIGILGRIDNRELYRDIIDHFDLLDDAEDDDGRPCPVEPIITTAIKFLGMSNVRTSEIDFDDMVYLPLIHKVRFWQFDNVFVDEAQDTNPARRALVRALVRKGGRVIAVGDRHQAIYGFTGADADSLDLIAQDFNCRRLPLTVTYRCPKAVVQFARQWVDHIEAHASAPEGSIGKTTFLDFVERKDLDGSAAILCRNTKPLVAAAFALIRRKIACRIEGREVGKSLTKLATKWTSIKTINALETKLTAYLERETTKLLAKKQEQKLQLVEDKVETLRVIAERCREESKTQIGDVVAYIEELFADSVTGILTLSTIHRSKGREWKRVFWLDRPNTVPSRYARQQWQVAQEMNLAYVCATRAMEELIDLEAAPDKMPAPVPQQETAEAA
jgi:DNA helicase-2/ATP-dependent DNA helicase PcrA